MIRTITFQKYTYFTTTPPEKTMSKAIEALQEAAQIQREAAEQSRKDASNARIRLDRLEAQALEHDNNAIDIEDAITKLKGDDS